MRQWKKMMAVFLSFAIALTSIYVAPKLAKAADMPMIYADEVMAEPGSEIEIPVRISGNTGLMGFGLDVAFDKEVLTPIDDITCSDLIAGQFQNSVEGTLQNETDTFRVIWAGTENMKEDGVLFTMKFKVSEEAAGVTSLSLKTRPDDTFDAKYNNVDLDCRSIPVVCSKDVPRIYAEEVAAEPGTDVEIPVKISGNQGIMGFGLEVGFDREVLTPIDEVEPSSLIAGQFQNSVENALESGGDRFTVFWAGTDNMKKDGELFTLKFKVSEKAEGTTKISLTLQPDNTFNAEYQDVYISCQAIPVTFAGEEPDTTEKPAAPTASALPPASTEDPDTTEEPDLPLEETKDPNETEDPAQADKIEAYLQYWSDANWTQSIDGSKDSDYAVEIDGNGEYQISFVATAMTDNIYRLFLTTNIAEEKDLPDGVKIIPTALRIGGTTYNLKKYGTDFDFGYRITVRNLMAGKDYLGVNIPVLVGDMLTLCFRVEGMKQNGGNAVIVSTPTPFRTSLPTAGNNPKTDENKDSDKDGSASKSQATKKPSKKSKSKNKSSSSSKLKKPKKVNLKKVTALGKKKVLVTWKWFSAQKGFQLQYAMNRKFTKKKKSVKKSASISNTLIKKLKKGKTYYFRIRAFNKSGGKKKYGKWSKVRKCKVK